MRQTMVYPWNAFNCPIIPVYPKIRNMAHKKKNPSSSLKKKAWAHFSIFIRTRDADWRGYVKCCTCGTAKQWKEGDAGHFISGRHNSVLFDERNCHFQCKNCNRNQGEQYKYGLFMQKRYGQEVIDELFRLDRKNKQFTRQELLDLIETYQIKSYPHLNE